MLVVCYSSTEEQQHCKCVMFIQSSSSAGSVLCLYRAVAVLVVCYSSTEEQQHCKCVILIQSCSITVSVLF